jgi:magnesium transporter
MDASWDRFLFLSELIGLPVRLQDTNLLVGEVSDLSVRSLQVYPRVEGLLIKKRRGKGREYLSWQYVSGIQPSRQLTVVKMPESMHSTSGTFPQDILLRETFWDQQIVDITGSKVVRINDLHLLRDPPELYLVHIDIGPKGFLRRLGWLSAINWLSRFLIGSELKDRLISWKNVQPVSATTVTGSVSLTVPTTKLQDVHPADIADIIVDLGSKDRLRLLRSLDTETAARTLQEIPSKFRVQVAESLPVQELAALVEKMPMDEVVDLFARVKPAKVHDVYSLLPAEEVEQVRSLLKHSRRVAGSLMNTDFVAVSKCDSVDKVLKRLKSDYAGMESIYYIYVVDEEGRLSGELTLRDLLTSAKKSLVSELLSEKVIKVYIDDNVESVANVFYKYNFTVVPVVDEDERLVGIITIKDALKAVFPRIRQEAEESL